MAELNTLARPYAKAAFDHAKQHNDIVHWESFLATASQVAKDPSFVALLHNPAILASQKAAVLMNVCTNDKAKSPVSQVFESMQLPEGIDVNDLVKKSSAKSDNTAVHNFVSQLADNDRLVLLPEIYEQFNRFKSAELKQVDAYVTSAYPLSDDERRMLQERLAVSTQSIVILHEQVDASLIGGATIKIGDKFTDGSVRGKLKQLKTKLTQ